ncbi:hypothetical protein CFIMG_003529RA [Ceratocystis fimbriata CBS 114723]|uniref:Aminoglycoside phosphotransferase domain-containing protein n=1 Tax=Ceratocystis fimbriata CBS 114723 TaxID=1035309 RepID=A0A2C5X8L1_9PEZI|nr:hypothetical protein CFIMG_003529RA [Ceratocystis fimbriata CBS 114723]
MQDDSQSRVYREVFEALKNTEYAVSELFPVSGGHANFTMRGELKVPVEGTRYVLIKHAEPYMRIQPSFKLDLVRFKLEVEALKIVEHMPCDPRLATGSNMPVVSSPRVLYSDPASNTMVQSYFPSGIDLRSYGFSHLSQPTLGKIEREKVMEFGRALGHWLVNLHSWANSPTNTAAKALAASNVSGPALKQELNYGGLLAMKEKSPGALELLSDETINGVVNQTRRELDSSTHVVHGDFWTGNIVVPDIPISQITQLTGFVVDWELFSLGHLAVDVGQMIAEMYQLHLFRNIPAGLDLAVGFIDAYMSDTGLQPRGDKTRPWATLEERDDFAFRALLHVGAHLICVSPMPGVWGSDKELARVATIGAQLIEAAWAKDRAFFEENEAFGGFFKRP